MLDLILAAALLQAPNPCNALGAAATPAPACPRWRRVAFSNAGYGYVDPASVRREGQNVELLIRTEFSESGPGGGQTADARLRLDCAARTKTIIHLAVFDGAGHTILDEPVTTDQTARPPAGSPYDILIDEFCRPESAALPAPGDKA